ncbi:DUF3237 domain-containing protein [Alphaproteobacteria bacterium]|nr:DUF3237 domain-containing protein [Alphaproteobacteria bacterium]
MSDLEPKLEKVFRMEAILAEGYPVDASSQIVEVTGGVVLGCGRFEGAKGDIIAPSGDWLSVSPRGTFQLDVRASVLMPDGIILITYLGRATPSPEVATRMQAGETIHRKDISFMTNPVMKTASQEYAWVNDHIFIGAMSEFSFAQPGKPGHIYYDVYCAT